MMNDVYNKAMKKNFNDTGVFRCPVPNCNRIYSRRRSLSRHRQECGQLPRYLCSLCPYKSKRRDLLKSHMKHGHKLDHVREDQIIVRKDPPIVYHQSIEFIHNPGLPYLHVSLLNYKLTLSLILQDVAKLDSHTETKVF